MTEPAPRFDIALPVELTEEQADSSFRAISVNISESGMLVRSAHQKERGTVLRFAFAPFGGTAQVIWTHMHQGNGGTQMLLGMKFLAMKRRDRKVLVRMLNAPPSLSTA